MRRDVLFAAAAALVVALVAGAAPPNPAAPGKPGAQPPAGAAAPPRPDLVVEKIRVTATQPAPAGGTRVSVEYTIANATPFDSWNSPTAAGKQYWHDYPAFYQQMYSCLDVRMLPSGAFPPASGTECPIMLGAGARWTCNGSVTVSAGKRVEIRATVDSLNYIEESNEGNNSRTLTWPLLAVSPPLHR